MRDPHDFTPAEIRECAALCAVHMAARIESGKFVSCLSALDACNLLVGLIRDLSLKSGPPKDREDGMSDALDARTDTNE